MTPVKPKEKRGPLLVEERLELEVRRGKKRGFVIETNGMARHDLPEFVMEVPEGIYLSAACRILNDVARFAATRQKRFKTGQVLQIGRWTTVEFETRKDGRIEVKDGTDEELMT